MEKKMFNTAWYLCFTCIYIPRLNKVELQIASGKVKSDWFNSGLSELLQEDDFFSPCFYNNAYHNLDWYAIGRCEIRVLQELPEYDYYTQHLWFWEDLVEVYYNIGGGMHRIIADAYRLKGWRWFAYNAEKDPILFRWAMLGSLSLKKMGNDQERQIAKNDLMNIYENMLLAFGTRSDNAIVDGLLPEIRDAITSFDDDAIERMTKEMSSLKKENLRLTNDKAKLEKTIEELKKQIKHIQNSAIPHMDDQEAETVEKIERILQRVYSFANPIPELKNVSSKIMNLNRIWDNLSEETRKDVVSSIILFEQKIAVDIAILPLLRSLEREFTRHIFQPFMKHPGFDKLKRSICSNQRYSTTHSVLTTKNGVSPTLGSIPYIGSAAHDKKAKDSSELISLFSTFIGPVVEEFRNICSDLNRYRLGIDNARIVDLRNAIAHGKEEVTKHVDSKIFEAIINVLYCPPLELIVRVVRISRRTKK